MENQSSDNSNPVNKIVCRKCGGPHFTIKCGKEKNQEATPVANTVTTDTKPNSIESTEPKPKNDFKSKEHDKKHYDNKDNDNKDNHSKYYDNRQNDRPRKQYFKTTYRVKISDLPIDMTEEEMMELTSEWGHIVRIRVLNYPESSTAYVDFGYEEEADYFVKAIDKTPFEFVIISAIRVESQRQEKAEDN